MWKMLPTDYEWSFVHLVHNIFLLVFAETGIIGFIAIILFFFIPIKKVARIAKYSKKQVNSAYALGLFGAFCAMLIQNLVDLTWASPVINSLFFFLLGLANVIVNFEKKYVTA